MFPLGRQVASAEQDAQSQREALRRARQDAASAARDGQGKQQADAALRKFYQDVLPANASSARRHHVPRLSQLARESNLRLERGTNIVKQEKGSNLEKLTTTYMLTGDYRDVRQFIYSLETAPEFMVLENVALCRAGGRRSAADGEARRRDVFPGGQCRLTRRRAARPRPWLLLALGAAVVALVTCQLWPAATRRLRPSNRARVHAAGRRPGAVDPSCAACAAAARWMQPPPEPSTSGRNPFRFQPKAPPPASRRRRRRGRRRAPIPQPVEPSAASRRRRRSR